MVCVAFLRGINVGGNSIVSMVAIKEAFVAAGMSDVRTYINCTPACKKITMRSANTVRKLSELS